MAKSLKAKIRDAILDAVGSTCKDTSALVSESMDHKVSASKRLRIRFHLILCEFCRYYKEQLTTIRKVAQGLDEASLDQEASKPLKEDAKEKMKKMIRDND